MIKNLIGLIGSIILLIVLCSAFKEDYVIRHTERNCTITVTEKERANSTTFLIKGTDLDGNEKTFELDHDLADAIYENDLKIEIGETYQFTVTGKESHIPFFGEYVTIIEIN